MQMFRAALITFLTATALSASAASNLTALLRHVPEGMQVVVLTPSLDRALGNAKAFADSLELPDADDLSAQVILSEVLANPEQLDSGGPFVLGVNFNSEHAVLIATLRDSGAWEAITEAVEGETEIREVPTNDQAAFAATKGDVVILSDRVEVVKEALAGSSGFTELFEAQLAADVRQYNAAMCVNMVPLRPQITQYSMMAQGMLPMLMQQGGQQIPAAAMGMVQYFVNSAAGFATDLDAVIVSAQVSRDAVTVKKQLVAAAGSDLARYLGRVEPSAQPLLRRLGAVEDAAILLGYDWSLSGDQPGFVEGMMEALTRGAENELAAQGDAADEGKPDPEKVREVLKVLREQARLASGTNVALRISDEGKLAGAMAVFSPEPERLYESYAAFYEPEIMAAYQQLFMMDAIGPMDFEAKEEVVDGRKQLTAKMGFGNAQISQVYDQLFGGDPTWVASVGAESILCGMAGTKAASQALVKTLVNAETGRLPTRATEALKPLGENPQFVMVFDLPALARPGLKIAGQEVPVPDSVKEATPLAFAMHLKPQAIEFRGRLTTATIKALAEMGPALEALAPVPGGQEMLVPPQ